MYTWKKLFVNPLVTTTEKMTCSQTLEHVKIDHLELYCAVQ